MKPLSFSYDHETDVLTIEGEKYGGDLFRTLANAGPRWTPFQFRRRGGVLELQELESLRQIYCPPPKPEPIRHQDPVETMEAMADPGPERGG